MGPGRGVKNADATMKMVLVGIAGLYKDYVKGMIDWSETHRGLNPDGTINVPWDVLNFHIYSNNSSSLQYSGGTNKRAQCSDVSNAGQLTDLVKQYLAEQVAAGRLQQAKTEMWLTELGYDKNQFSDLKAVALPGKTVNETIADYTLRDVLFYGRKGFTNLPLYQFQNADRTLQSTTVYTTMGLVNINDDSAGVDKNVHYPASRFLAQSRALMKDYHFVNNISVSPAVDLWQNDAGTKVYAVWSPTET